jgi:hypothetical protein
MASCAKSALLEPDCRKIMERRAAAFHAKRRMP